MIHHRHQMEMVACQAGHAVVRSLCKATCRKHPAQYLLSSGFIGAVWFLLKNVMLMVMRTDARFAVGTVETVAALSFRDSRPRTNVLAFLCAFAA